MIRGEAVCTDSVLIVSSTEGSLSALTGMLSQNTYDKIATAANGGEARRMLISQAFDLCIINAPLKDEFGDRLACDVATHGLTQVILIVKAEIADEVSAKLENFGVFTVSKPINKAILWSAVRLANAAFNKIRRMQNENDSLRKKIDDIRLVDRAKCLLIEYLGMTESQAHHHIEKQAMDMRVSKKEIAESILKT